MHARLTARRGLIRSALPLTQWQALQVDKKALVSNYYIAAHDSNSILLVNAVDAYNNGWLRGPAVEHRSLAEVLSLSCARLVADG